MRLILVCLLAALSWAGFAQTGDWVAQSGPYGGNVRDIEYDASSGWTYAIIDFYLYYSDDAGATWTKTASGISGVDIEIGGGTVYVISNFDVYTSPVGQDNFVQVNVTSPSNMTRLRRMPNGTLVALGQFFMYVSTNNGVNWSSGAFLPSSATFVPSMLEVSNDNKVIVINSSNNQIYVTSTPGSSVACSAFLPALAGTVTSIATDNTRLSLYASTTGGLFGTASTGGGSWVDNEGAIGKTTLSSLTYPSLIEFSADGLHMFFVDNHNHEIWEKTVAEAATNWTEVGFPGPGGFPGTGRIIRKAISSTAGGLLLGSFTGIHKSVDGGATFSNANDDVLGIRSINMGAFGGTLFINAEESGLYSSNSNGLLWEGEPRVPGPVNTFTYTKDHATNNDVAVFALKHSPAGAASDLYRMQSVGGIFNNWAVLASAPEFEWVDLMDGGRAIGMLFGANSPLQYSHDRGTTWAAITVSGLPGSYDFNDDEIFMASATQIFVQDQFSGNYYRINLNVGSGPPFSGTATAITLPPSFNVNDFTAKAGRFYLLDTNSSPDRFAVSTDGGTNWTVRNTPGSGSTELYVADNGYLFINERFGQKIHYSRNDGASFTVSNFPTFDVGQSISDLYVDTEGYIYLAMYEDVVYKSKKIIVLPNAPSDLQSVATTSSTIVLRWKDEALNEENHTVERSTNGIDFVLVGTVDADDNCSTPSSRAFFTDSNLTPGTTYTYRITAYNEAGTSTAITAAFSTLATCASQLIPDGRSWTATNAGGNGFSATSVPNIGIRYLGNNIYDVENIDMGLAPSGSALRGTFFLDCDQTIFLQDNSTDLRSNGFGLYNSVAKTITIKWALCEDLTKFETVTFTQNATNTDAAPSTPIVQALASGDSQVEISWTTGFNQKDFVVERSTTSPSSGFSQIGGSSIVNYPTNSFVDPGPFTIGSPYYYRVRARNHNLTPLEATGNAELVFAKPNFVLSATEVTNFVALTIGSFWGDFDGDGIDDLFTLGADLTNPSATAQAYMFRNLGTGDFVRSTITIDAQGYAGALATDFNNDNRLDLVLFESDGNALDLYQGNGDLTFVKLSPSLIGELGSNLTGDNITSVSSADVNLDGRLDLLVFTEMDDFSTVIPPQLFIRQANGTYTKVTGGALATHPNNAQFGAWSDFNNDNIPDVLVVESTLCILYQGIGDGTFTVASGTNIVDRANSAVWADYNNDSHMDLFFSISSAPFPVLYRNNGNGSFTRDNSTVLSAVSANSSSAFWGDINNDAKLDVILPGVTTPTAIFINTTVGATTTFNKITTERLSKTGSFSLGASPADYDRDGFLDVSVAGFSISGSTVSPSNFSLFANNNTTGNWVEVRLRGNPSNSQGIGARVRVQAGGTILYRQVESNQNPRSQGSTMLHFGLGSQSSITSITVEWPSGATQVYNSPPINTAITIVEDTQGPLPSLLSPTVGATGVGVSAAVEVTFDEPVIRDGTKKILVHRVSDAALVFQQSVSTGTQSGNKYTFSFGSQMAQSTEFEVSFEAGAFTDIYGNAFAGFSPAWKFTTAAGPQITLLSPLNGAAGVPSNTAISITFNVPTTGVAGKNITIYRTSDLTTPVRVMGAGTAVADGNKQTMTFTPNLPTETAFTVIVDAGAFKDAGDAVSAGGQWTFTTMPPPKFTTLLPADDATGIAANTTLEITFDQPVTAEAGKKIFLFKNAEPTAVFEANVTSGSITGNKVTFTVAPKLLPLTNYTVIVDAFAFKDAVGNLFTGIGSGQWNFTTIQGPSISSSIPANGATSVSTASTIAITFNRPLVSAVAGKKITVLDGAATVANLDVSTNGSISGSTYTLSAPVTRWPVEKLLTVTLDAGAFLDAGGNDSDVLSAGAYSFTTVPGPKFTTLVPADGATAIAANTTLEITFDQTVTAEPGKKVRVYKNADPTAVFEGDVANGAIVGNKVTFVITPKLIRETDYTVIIDAFAFKDAAGNLFAGLGSTEWNFRTDVGPAILGYSPASGASDVPTTTAIEITFSRTLSSAVANKKIKVFDGATAIVDVNVTASGTISGTKYTLPAPPGGWPASKLLSVTIDAGAFTDAGGNESDGLVSGLYSFNTQAGPAGPAIVSFFPAAGATATPLNASLEITFDKTVSAVATKTIRVMDGATQVITSDVSTTGTVAGAKYTYPAPAGGWPVDKLLAVLVDAGAFVDIGSRPSLAISGSQWTFRTLSAPDATAPTIIFTSISTVDKTSLPSSITARVTDNVSVQSARLFIRGIAGSQFTEITGTGPTTNDTYTFSISTSAFDAIGAQYYFTAVDATGNLARFPTTGYQATYVRYSAGQSAIPNGLVGTGGSAGGWKAISVPFELGSNNAVSAVFDEFFGGSAPLVYKQDWRLLILNQAPLSWKDYGEGFSNIDRGTGYMINVRDQSRANALSIGNDLTAPANTRDNLFKYTLRAGWNLIGNPYLTPINWANVVTLNNLQGAATVFKKFNNGQYPNNGLLQPFEGGFVQVDAEIEITIPFEGQVASGGREKEIVFREGDWLLPITLRQSDRENTLGGVGMHHESMRSFDRLDDFNGPQFIEFIEMNFEHPNDFPKVFSRDVVNLHDEYVWDFTVAASGEEMATMLWDSGVTLPGEAELFLWDVEAHAVINMREESAYNFDPKLSRKFRIFFGKEARDRIKPERSLLGQPYPNPTSGISYIPFALPDGKAEYGVKIEVFDLMGRKVTTLEDGQFAPGLHNTQWNGQDSPYGTGLYSIRMTVVTSEEQEVYNAKIVLNK